MAKMKKQVDTFINKKASQYLDKIGGKRMSKKRWKELKSLPAFKRAVRRKIKRELDSGRHSIDDAQEFFEGNPQIKPPRSRAILAQGEILFASVVKDLAEKYQTEGMKNLKMYGKGQSFESTFENAIREFKKKYTENTNYIVDVYTTNDYFDTRMEIKVITAFESEEIEEEEI